jgi:hypothetical protein
MRLEEFADIGTMDDALRLIEKNSATSHLGVFVESVASKRSLFHSYELNEVGTMDKTFHSITWLT